VSDEVDLEVRRRRAVALAALVTGFLLLVVAVVSAVSGSGDDDGRPVAATATATTATTERERRPARPRRPPLRRPAAVPASAPGAHRAPEEPVPILVYHFVNTPPAGTPDPERWTPPEDFAAQVRFLAEQGYHAVTVQQVWDAWHENGLLPSKPIVISFETGYHSHFSAALPVLRGERWPGVLNLRLSQTRGDFPAREVEALVAAGWELNSATIDGGDLTTADDATLEEQLAGSRRALRGRFRVPVNFVSYPEGRYDERVAEVARAAGYLAALTDEEGVASPDQDPFALRRLEVDGTAGVEGLRRRLEQVADG
jgi:peptidoglycan/xylan/chitin deacetylase (PgdA/CDA1 family)